MAPRATRPHRERLITTSAERRRSDPRFFALLLVAGCAHAAPEAAVLGPQPIVVAVEFRGAKRLSHGQLLDHIYTGEKSLNPLRHVPRYDPGVVALDRTRIEALYHAFGHLDAKVRLVEVVPVGGPGDQGEPGPGDDEVRVVFHIEEGLPTRVRRVNFAWTGGAPVLAADARRSVEERTWLKPADV